MRFTGKLQKWNDDRGFGFIEPLQGGERVFVHISAFPRDGRCPAIGESLSFEAQLSDDGRKSAVRIRRAQALSKPSASERTRGERRGSRRPGLLALPLAVAAAIAAAVLLKFSGPTSLPGATRVHTAAKEPATSTGIYRCDGRTHCSQMTSCAEATFFLKHCPDTQMDGNGDGVPCERQWCTGPFAR